MELHFLGTGAGLPAKKRNVSSLALRILNANCIWLFDCGEATQHQILHTPLSLCKITKLFISHLHGDHIFGIPGLLSSRSSNGATSELTIYGPHGIQDFVRISLHASYSRLSYPLKIQEIDEGIIYKDSQFTVSAGLLAHGIPCFGYRIVERHQPGTLYVEKLVALGVKPGPIYQEIKAGKTVIVNGRQINGAEYVGPPIPGRVVTILGDTRFCSTSLQLAQNASVLVHEATFGDEESKLANTYFHSTAKQAAEVAACANAQKLILNHISSRYQENREQILLAQAREVFVNTELAQDLSCYPINRA